MAPPSQKKRKLDDAVKGKTPRPKRKKIRKQDDYHSSEDDDSDTGFAPVNLRDSDEEPQDKSKANSEPLGERKPKPTPKTKSKPPKSLAEESPQDEDSGASSGDEEQDSEPDADADGAPTKRNATIKRNDPTAFSTSITKILSTKLPQSARHDPLLSRSAAAHANTTTASQSRLEARAKAQLRAQRKADLERNRVTDVLGLESGNAGEVAEEEKRLRKIAQRGVVKLFNAVRAAQVRSEEALREEREKGTVGRKEREERAKEISKKGFLELIGGKKERRTVSGES